MGLFSNSVSFDPVRDIPDLSKKVILVTGGNVGLGKETVLQLSKHDPATIYLAARTRAKFDTAMADIVKANPSARDKITFLELDLSSFASVKRAADTVLASSTRLDLLINNAGVMALPPGLTTDGYEIQFGTNHMGHALLTKLLMPLLLRTAAATSKPSDSPASSSTPGDVRIINLTSAGEMLAPKTGFLAADATTPMASFHSYTRYGQSKLANVLFTLALARRYPTLTAVAVHPGRVHTNLLDRFFADGFSLTAAFQRAYDAFNSVSVERGVANQLWAAVAERGNGNGSGSASASGKVKSGEYYAPVGKVGGQSKLAKDPALADRLWEWQEAEFKAKGY